MLQVEKALANFNRTQTQFSSGDKLYSSQSSVFSPRIEKKNLFDNKFVKRFLVR